MLISILLYWNLILKILTVKDRQCINIYITIKNPNDL